jgi:uncharacterized membrane protein YphA (DoxX/SURF4 family)
MKNLLYAFFQPIVALASRLYIAIILGKSVWVGLRDFEGRVSLYQHEFDFSMFPALIANAPRTMAYIGTGAELFVVISLALGLFTRLGALVTACVLAMQYIVYISVKPEIGSDGLILQAALVAWIFAFGAGKLSVDKFIK